jgi:hypothetical protein
MTTLEPRATTLRRPEPEIRFDEAHLAAAAFWPATAPALWTPTAATCAHSSSGQPTTDWSPLRRRGLMSSGTAPR